MLDQTVIRPTATVEALPRAIGNGLIKVKRKADKSALSDLRMSGCLKVLFSRGAPRLDAIMINSAGGLTSGDRLAVQIELEEHASASVTTQAAERAYRAADGRAQVTSKIQVAQGAQLLWVPQELILFDGAKLDRRLECDLDEGARLLLVEPVIFGRAKMGESVRDLWFRDHIRVDRKGVPLYRDQTLLTGDMQSVLGGAAIAQGAGAMASVVYVSPDAASNHGRLVKDLPSTAGASLLQEDMMVLRLLAADGFELRKSLLPILDRLTDDTLPTSWRL